MKTNAVVAAGCVAMTTLALALAAITEARHENPSLAEAREESRGASTTPRGRATQRGGATQRGTAIPRSEPTSTRTAGIPAERRRPLRRATNAPHPAGRPGRRPETVDGDRDGGASLDPALRRD